ncbi:hypothetical protein PINS_up010962 [Pythium insidiosum]|nr:hypothetical protein PINS_up010962 [Pythium insidiosum]
MLAQNELVIVDHEDKRVHANLLVSLKAVTSLATLALDALILLQHWASHEILRLENMAPANSHFLRSRWLLILLELALCSFHIPPGIAGVVPIEQFHSTLAETANSVCRRSESFDLVQRGQHCYLVYVYPVEVFGVFMVVRLYLFGRYLRSSSSLYSQWVAFIGSLNEINAMRPFFHFKALFKIRPMHLLVPLTLLNTFLTAAIIRILEQPVQPVFANYWKSVWLTAVTIVRGSSRPILSHHRSLTDIDLLLRV